MPEIINNKKKRNPLGGNFRNANSELRLKFVLLFRPGGAEACRVLLTPV